MLVLLGGFLTSLVLKTVPPKQILSVVCVARGLNISIVSLDSFLISMVMKSLSTAKQTLTEFSFC